MQAGIDPLLTWKAAVVPAWFALFFVAERWRPAAAQRLASPAWRRLLRNGALWAINVVLSPLIVVPISAAAAAHGLGWRPLWWGGANHEAAFLWRFHAVHHLDRFLDTTSALRFHFGEVLLSALARAVVIVVLALPLASVLIFETLVLMAALFHHSNLRLPTALERALSFLVVTPAIHWVHHHRARIDTDSNYCTILSIWDPLFRSRSRTQRQRDMAIGVEGREEAPLLALLAAPFRSNP
jgi:sterol desaturase/sphingolipid hydroxylase (fatty acid hydroxylase superfamily)